MNFRKGKTEDIIKINKIYEKIIENMVNQGIDIWKIFNPCNFFEEDIKNERLYLLEDEEKDEIAGAFVVFNETKGAKYINWSNNEKAIYLSRLGVNPEYQNKGIGKKLIEKSKEIAKEKNAKSVRLLVVDINVPAYQFYKKNNFTKAEGIYYDKVNEETTFTEYGLELNM